MILITVGTVEGFDALIRRMDELAAGFLREHEIVAQIAAGRYEPRHMTWSRYMENIGDLFRRADLIIGHGGTGTAIEALKLGKRFVGVANRTRADDHQHEFLVELARRGLIVHCTDLPRLDEAVEQALQRTPVPADTTAFGRRIASAIEADLRGIVPSSRFTVHS